MNIQQVNQLNVQIELFRKINLEKLFIEAYENQTSINNILISRMTVSEFIYLANRLIKQLENELRTNNRIVLPYIFTTPEFGQYTLDSCLTNLNSYIINKNFGDAENVLLWLAHYQLQNGFYDKSNSKIHSVEALELSKSKSDLNLLSKNYLELKLKYDGLLVQIESSKKQLDDFYTIKQNELQQISSNLNTANSNNNQIQNLLNSVIQSQTKVNSLYEQAEKEKGKIEIFKAEIEKTYNDFKDSFNFLIDNIKTSDQNFLKIYEDFIDKLNFFESKHTYFQERNEYLDNLIGREVGASLFETFKQRKTELKSSVALWAWLVPISVILTIIYIGLLFYFFPVTENNKWEIILINSLKSIPAIFLLYFITNQYKKERNFQEEYAFKSAVALTIKAYAEQLSSTENKDIMIIEAVKGVFSSPFPYNSKEKNQDSSNSIIEGIKAIKETAVEAIKNK